MLMNIPKAVGFRGVSCDTCMSSTSDPIFSFDRLVSAVKIDHTCDSHSLSKIQNRTDISHFRKASCEWIINFLVQIISGRVGSESIFLTAEELQAPCSKLNLQYFAGKILPQYKLRCQGHFIADQLYTDDTCMSSTSDPIFSFDRLVSAVKIDHTCDSQSLSKIQNRTDISHFV
jgi:hypothetical protein